MAASKPAPSVRIVGGEWRGRRIAVPASDVRPTPDRVRETVFNWLQPWIDGARCLDLFAGTGAFGFEALSRGAASAVLVERDPVAVHNLQATKTALKADAARIEPTSAALFLQAKPQPFDIVFLDPPFASGELAAVLAQLSQGWIAPAGLIYIESPAAAGTPALPPSWTWLRNKTAGQVGYHLARGA